MTLPANRIRFARQIAARLARLASPKQSSQIAAEAARLIREFGASPEFAARNASARAATIIALEARP